MHEKIDAPQVEPGLRVCRSCRRDVTRAVRTLPESYSRLLGFLKPAPGRNSDKVTGSADPAMPIVAAVAAERDLIRAGLRRWCAHVTVERSTDKAPLRPPAGREPAYTGPWLLRHVEWLLGREVEAEHFARFFLERAARARRLLNPDGARTVVLGVCTELVTPDQECGGDLVATVRASDDKLPSKIRCRSCGFQITSSQFVRWGLKHFPPTSTPTTETGSTVRP